MPGLGESEDPWELFLGYCALAREKPGFDAEEREDMLELADTLARVIEAARDEGEWVSTLMESPAIQPSLPTIATPIPTPMALRDQRWLRAWIAEDQESLRRAIAAFAASGEDAVARYDRFARAALAKAAEKNAAVRRASVLAFGSVFNFAVDPGELPYVRRGLYRRLGGILGWEIPETEDGLEPYRSYLEFARHVRSRMRQAGIPARDMLDVQGLMLNAAAVHHFWAPGRRCPESARGRRRKDEDSSYLSICAIYRDEAPYLREWVELHRLAGVERFFLYDNRSADKHREVLAPRIEDGTVVVREWPDPRGQIPAYEHCLREHGERSRWIAFLDLDEFLFSPIGTPLPQLLEAYERFPGVGVNWCVFGPSGHETRPEGLVVESYLQRLNVPDNRTVKSIVDPARVVGCNNVHDFAYECSGAVDENGYPVFGYYTKSVSFSKLRINHYVTKSVAEYRARGERDRPDQFGSPRSVRLDRIVDTESRFGERDETILRYLAPLKKAVTR